MRETQEWADWELDVLERYHALHGSAFVQTQLAKRGVQRSAYSIRHKASRLGLSHAMREMTPASDVAQEAGVSLQAVHDWLKSHGYRRHCRTWGRELLLPGPAVALYLNERRAPGRPRGWWGTARTADELGVSVSQVHYLIDREQIDAVQCGNTFFIDPYSVTAYQQSRPAHANTNEVMVCRVAEQIGVSHQYAKRRLTELQVPMRYARNPNAPGRALFMAESHAQAFISAGAFKADVLDRLIRRSIAADQKSQI